MTYEVRCTCSKTHEVSAADAGSMLRCTCGRNVDVPPLHVLRTSAGEHGVSPSVQLQAMLHNNELPGTRSCACCHRETDHQIRVSVVCEQVITKEPAAKGAVLLGCLVSGLLGGLVMMLLSKSGQRPIQHGTQVSFVLPVCVCEVCDRDVTTPHEIRKALAATPIYAALLDQYPEAQTSLVD